MTHGGLWKAHFSNRKVIVRLSVCASATVSRPAGTKYRLRNTPILPLGFFPWVLPPVVYLSLPQIQGLGGGHCATDGCPFSSQPPVIVPEGTLDPLSAALPIDRMFCHPQACHEFFIKKPVDFGKCTIRSTINNVPRGGIHRAGAARPQT